MEWSRENALLWKKLKMRLTGGTYRKKMELVAKHPNLSWEF
jgi:hypothetical protein